MGYCLALSSYLFRLKPVTAQDLWPDSLFQCNIWSSELLEILALSWIHFKVFTQILTLHKKWGICRHSDNKIQDMYTTWHQDACKPWNHNLYIRISIPPPPPLYITHSLQVTINFFQVNREKKKHIQVRVPIKFICHFRQQFYISIQCMYWKG